MVKPCFTYFQKSNEMWYVVDIPGFVYGEGNSETEAVNAAMDLGVSADEINISSEVI